MSTSANEVKKRTQRDYSLSFKLSVVDEVEKGELSTYEAKKKYGIQGRSTVLVWLRKHGRLDWSIQGDTMSKAKTPNKQIRELEKRIKRLEADKEILNTAIDIADQMLNTNIRKKYLRLSSDTTNGEQALNDDTTVSEK